MIKVLQINAGSEVFGGVSALILNLYRNIDRDLVQFDFLSPNKTTYSQYREEIEEMNGRLIDFGINASNLKGKVRLYKKLKSFLKETSYDIIHINSGVLLFNYVVAAASRSAGAKNVIVHSHSNGGRSITKEKLSGILKRMLAAKADVLLACSDSAAEYMFPAKDKAVIIKNGIDAEKYAFNTGVRDEVRRELGINDEYVIGNVGRLMPEKNHEFMLNVLDFIINKENNGAVKLMLVGGGKLENDIRNMVEQRGLGENVIMLGARSDVHRIYQAMDVFFLPSLFEGFGIVNLEAQAAGLHCIVSDTVPAEVDVSAAVTRLPLDGDIKVWVDALMNGKYEERKAHVSEITAAGYDIKASAKQLEKIYASMV